jgi:Zn-dependent protease
MNPHLIDTILIGVAAYVPAIVLHELAHGVVAYFFGDQTARRAGRLTLNPIAHVDRMGTIILPGILLVSQLLTLGRVAFMFGWAKPVPVDPSQFKHPRQDMALVAIAGPVTNFILAFIGALVFVHGGPTDGLWGRFLVLFMVINVALGLFNLIPLPPLDGGRIVVGILPLQAAIWWSKIERLGILMVLLLIFVLPFALSQLGIAFDPVSALMNNVVPRFVGFLLQQAGLQAAQNVTI